MCISVYTKELGELICEETATSTKGLKHICSKLDIAYSTVTGWIYDDKHPLSEMYARAKMMQAEMMADEILKIADDTANDTIDGEYGPLENKEWVNRSKLKVDSRKWLLSKLLPKKYGDKVDVTSGGEKVNQVFNIAGQTIEF